MDERGVADGFRRELGGGDAGVGPPFASLAMFAGMCCVSIGTALFGSGGRMSRKSPPSSGLSTLGFDQKCGTMKVTGPLKLPVFRNSVQHWLPVGTSCLAVVLLAVVSGVDR